MKFYDWMLVSDDLGRMWIESTAVKCGCTAPEVYLARLRGIYNWIN